MTIADVTLPTFTSPEAPARQTYKTRQEIQRDELAKLAAWRAAEDVRPWWMPRTVWRPGKAA
jgi:hypothetical protein